MIVINAILRLVTFSQHLSPQVHAGLRDAYPAPSPLAGRKAGRGLGASLTPRLQVCSQKSSASFAPTVERRNSVIQ